MRHIWTKDNDSWILGNLTLLKRRKPEEQHNNIIGQHHAIIYQIVSLSTKHGNNDSPVTKNGIFITRIQKKFHQASLSRTNLKVYQVFHQMVQKLDLLFPQADQFKGQNQITCPRRNIIQPKRSLRLLKEGPTRHTRDLELAPIWGYFNIVQSKT